MASRQTTRSARMPIPGPLHGPFAGPLAVRRGAPVDEKRDFSKLSPQGSLWDARGSLRKLIGPWPRGHSGQPLASSRPGRYAMPPWPGTTPWRPRLSRCRTAVKAARFRQHPTGRGGIYKLPIPPIRYTIEILEPHTNQTERYSAIRVADQRTVCCVDFWRRSCPSCSASIYLFPPHFYGFTKRKGKRTTC